MDLYNLHDGDHRLMKKSYNLKGEGWCNRDVLRQQIFNTDKLATKKWIVVAEEDPKIQRNLLSLIREENPLAHCIFADSVEEVPFVLLDYAFCDLLIANYYFSEAEIDFEFLENLRFKYPSMDIAIMSHVNDKEFFEKLKKLKNHEMPVVGKRSFLCLKGLLSKVFGGNYGSD